MSNTTTTAAIRTALKTAGFNARQVTVKDRSYGDIKVTIRDASVPLSTVATIAKAFENVRRCEASGEILCGGNTYVEVCYDQSVLGPVADAVEALITATEPGYQVKLAGGYTATRFVESAWHTEVRAHGPGFGDSVGLICFGVRHASEQIAAKYLDSRAVAS